MKINEYIQHKLKTLDLENPLQEIRYILQEKLNISFEEQIFNKDLEIKNSQILALEKIFEQRKKRRPLSKIFNKAYFRDISLLVNKHTFSPRIDSEVLIDVLIEKNININNILELGTGTGALSISLLKYFEKANSLVTDISKEAIYIAKKNAILNNTYTRMQFVCCDWLSCFKNLNFDILISNPPYIKKDEIKLLDDEVKKYDPTISLDGGNDGLDAYREILKSIAKIGSKELLVLFEIGFDQAEEVSEIMKKNGLKKIQTFKDYCNLSRCVLGKT
ncbi:peptide chain release factor N(5)-glutamine methyltransferase [Alphaproteobacteria bacterium]|nr:peptide chain release factor N(5)-glutamine methyltransferase [Alphaproteobacteria bacterium]